MTTAVSIIHRACSRRAVGILFSILLSQAVTLHADTAAPAKVFESGQFALYLPADVSEVRGIFLALGGPDTRAFFTGGKFRAPFPELEASLHILGEELRSLAAEYGLAMMGTPGLGQPNMSNGPETDQLIFAAIANVAEISGHAELRGVPLFVYGISGGSLQAAGFAARNPGRTGALLLKVPGLPQRLDDAIALAVPTYLVLAEKETFADNREVAAVFESNRQGGGLWALAVEPGVPHHSLKPRHRALSLNWLRAVVALRLGAAAHDPLRIIAESSGWLGHPAIGVSDWESFTGDRGKASWFPSRATAEEWWEFISSR